MLLEQTVPTFFVLENMDDLIHFIGKEAIDRRNKWDKNMAPMLSLNEALYPVLVKHLKTVEQMSLLEAELLSSLVKQLSFQMGVGQYLRALPLVGVDTKFLENYQTLVSDILDVLHGGEVTEKGGCLSGLVALKIPKAGLLFAHFVKV